MESLGDMLKKQYNLNMTSNIIKEYDCEGCKEKIIVRLMTIPFGQHKGQNREIKFGCKCFELEEAKKAFEERELKRLDIFNSYNFGNEHLKDSSFEKIDIYNDSLSFAVKYAKEYINGESTLDNILLQGGYGAGKSTIAYLISEGFKVRSKTSVFISAPKLFSMIQNSYNRHSDVSESGLMKVMSDVDLLVLDDIGAEYSKKTDEQLEHNWTNSKYFEIIESRQGKKTIYTTNMTGKMLVDKIGGRNVSRIYNNTKLIKIDADDYRLRSFEK